MAYRTCMHGLHVIVVFNIYFTISPYLAFFGIHHLQMRERIITDYQATYIKLKSMLM